MTAPRGPLASLASVASVRETEAATALAEAERALDARKAAHARAMHREGEARGKLEEALRAVAGTASERALLDAHRDRLRALRDRARREVDEAAEAVTRAAVAVESARAALGGAHAERRAVDTAVARDAAAREAERERRRADEADELAQRRR